MDNPAKTALQEQLKKLTDAKLHLEDKLKNFRAIRDEWESVKKQIEQCARALRAFEPRTRKKKEA